ncbi:MAG: hypothetical protein COV44_06750 [Deltaproteobacteria bacterium CG11_big_fil_rev_8_21_14_0_20_45_16]|nr:MAG: hypothetical protein COV44_06750 [Deltaproteobacteria bacterium CG11_big_fil_rev_8_21_14_0_20_45_16]
MSRRRFLLFRSFVLVSLWLPGFFYVWSYAENEIGGKRLESLSLSNGRVASVQREYIFKKDEYLQPGDRILEIEGRQFEFPAIKKWLSGQKKEFRAKVLIDRNGKRMYSEAFVRGYSERDILVLLVLPGVLSLIFLGFALLTPFQTYNLRKTQESVEVFSVLCFFLSIFFLLSLPSLTLGLHYPVSLLTPLMGGLILHLFCVYPKRKGSDRIRIGLIVLGYLAATTLIGWRVIIWDDKSSTKVWHFADLVFLGLCLISAMCALGNTLFTSKDFWARRRARILSVVFILFFIGLVSVFFSFLWTGPRISWERILGVSVLFPVAFAFVFSKENVFDLERIFRRGLHQILFMGIAVLFAVLVGMSWQQLSDQTTQYDWILWSTIAMCVVLVARPVGLWFEARLGSLIQLRVRFPKVDEIFEASENLENFLTKLSQHFHDYLNMESVTFRFYRDPTNPWSKDNEQIWQYREGRLQRMYAYQNQCFYFSNLKRGSLNMGDISFSGGDALAFDPVTSASWDRVVHAVAQCLELLVLRDYLLSQQGLLAVGRMQALLAHEMKNPLAVIKICSGLLQSHIDESEEAEEIVRTIQNEVERVSDAIQGIFNHSGRDEKRDRVDLYQLIEKVKQSCLARFPRNSIELKLLVDSDQIEWKEGALWMWTEREGLRQSLMNLVINAFEAGSDWVGIEIYARSRQHLRIVVKDHGPGIPKELDLFKPFVTTKANGTGLGLSHVKAFVDRHSGRIQVSSRSQKGTSFVMEFSPEFVLK